MVKLICCMNSALQISDLHNNTCIENTSEHHTLRWWKTKNLLLPYAVLLCSCVILLSGRDKKILMHHLDFDSGQLKLWNTSLKLYILECQHHEFTLSTSPNPKSIWRWATEYVDFLTFFLKNEIFLAKLLVAEYFYLKTKNL